MKVALAGARQPSEIEDSAAGVVARTPEPDVGAEIHTIMAGAVGTSSRASTS